MPLVMPLPLLLLVLVVLVLLLLLPLFLGTRLTIFANVSALAGSFGIQLSGCARRMCSHIERYAKF